MTCETQHTFMCDICKRANTRGGASLRWENGMAAAEIRNGMFPDYESHICGDCIRTLTNMFCPDNEGKQDGFD